jgi:hypothetical protein
MTHPLKQRIAALRTRVRRLVTVYAVSWIIGAVVAAILILGMADYLLRFQDRGIRLICSLAALGVLAWTAYRYLVVGLCTSLSDVELALRVQRRFPRLGDGLASAVEFLGQSEEDPTAGSVGLRRAVIAQTTAETEPLDFRQALRSIPALRVALTASAVCLVALILVVADPLSCRTALARLVNPFGKVAWPQTYHLVLLEPVVWVRTPGGMYQVPWDETDDLAGSEPITRVAKGGVFEAEVVDRDGQRLPSEVRIHYRFQGPDGRVAEESKPMQFVDGKIAARREDGSTDPGRRNGVMVARRENVSQPFSYRVEGGDDRSMPWIPVEVLEPPSLESWSTELIPPDYTGWPPEEADKQIRALVGTRVKLSAGSTKPLRSAVLCLEGGVKIEGRLSGQENRRVDAEFVVERSGAYWFELTGVEGLTGGSEARWEIRAVPDAPPTISIERPAGNVFVTPEAMVPLRIAAKDDLAVRSVELRFSGSDSPEEDESVISLYTGPDRVAPQAEGLSGVEMGHNLVLPPYDWRLAELGLQPGTQVTFHATATDYLPNTGQSDPRRLIVITPEELTERIASRQASILAELSRVLQMQKQSRGQVGDLEIRLHESGRFWQLDVDHLRGAELNQRQVNRTLTSSTDGLPTHILGLLADLENNKVDSPDIQRQMHALLDEIDRLDREHLPIIGRELTAAIKSGQIALQDRPADDAPPGDRQETKPLEPDPAMIDSLAAAGGHQDQVIASLEQMLDQLGQWDRYRRFHSQISRLLREQQELQKNTEELGRRTLTKTVEELLPQESADLKIAARRQFELARDLDRIQQAMERAADQLRESNPLFAETISDALHRAQELATAGLMRSAATDVQANQMGQAIGRQEQVIEHLHEILDILANRREHELGRLARQLRDAESELAKMAQRQEGLKGQMEEAEGLSDQEERRRELERLSREQQKLQEDAERMARRLERLMAESASQTVTQAGQKMNQAAQSAQQGSCQGAAKQAGEAKKDLDEARRQVRQRRLEAEVQLALEQLAQLEQTVRAMHRHQETIIQETQRLDQLLQEHGQLTRAQNMSLHHLARDQGLLESETLALTEKLVGADVLNLALSGAARQMRRAADLLQRRETGAPTQQAEQNALQRLGQLLEALQPEEPEEPEDDQGAGGGQGGQGSEQPPGSGVQTLVELKLLRLLQEEINQRTRALEATFGDADSLTDEARREYAQLSEEQGRLAELLLDLIQPQEDPEDNPDALPDGGE